LAERRSPKGSFVPVGFLVDLEDAGKRIQLVGERHGHAGLGRGQLVTRSAGK